MKKDFLRLNELTKEDIYQILDLTKYYKAKRKDNVYASILKNKSIGKDRIKVISENFFILKNFI